MSKEDENVETAAIEPEVQAEDTSEEIMDVTDDHEMSEIEEMEYNYRMDNYKTLIDKRNREKEEILIEVRKKYKGIRLFSLTLPYNGTFVIKPQEMSDTKFITVETEKFTEAELKAHGGREAISKMDKDAQARIFKDIDTKVADYSNELLLRRCILYPFDINERLDSDEPGKNIPIGAATLILERIVDVSGWQDVIAEEV